MNEIMIGKIFYYVIAFFMYVIALKLMDKWKKKKDLPPFKDFLYKLVIFLLFAFGLAITPPIL